MMEKLKVLAAKGGREGYSGAGGCGESIPPKERSSFTRPAQDAH